MIMRRRVKDFIEVSDYTSLDRLIMTLTAIRDSLPDGSEAELAMKGDDIFGRRLSISYFRELTEEEALCDARYTGAVLPASEPSIDAIRKKLDSLPFDRSNGSTAKRRKVA